MRKIGSYNKKTIKLQKQRRKEKYENIKRRKLQDPNWRKKEKLLSYKVKEKRKNRRIVKNVKMLRY